MGDYKKRSPRSVGVRELKAGAAGIMRAVREEQAAYVVTHRGREVAVILPAQSVGAADAARSGDAWSDFVVAGRRVARAFRKGDSAVAELASSRR
jgi:prevent-host-death family protein